LKNKVEYFPIKTATACPLKWSLSTLYLNKGISRTCHRSTKTELTPENFENFHNTHDVLEGRKKMLEGKWPSSDNDKYNENWCGYCRKIEDYGGISDRQLMLNIPNLVPRELKNNINSLIVSPTTVEVFFNNTCNLGCLYCTSTNSSIIEQEEKKFGFFNDDLVSIKPLTEKYSKNLIPHFWDWFKKNGDNLERFHALGGETFYQKEFYNLLDFFDENPKPNLIFNVVSNLDINHEKLIEIIEKIKKLLKDRKLKRFDLTCSIDCWGPQQEYVRYGLNLKNWEKNFNYVLNQKWIYLTTNTVVFTLTIKTMPDLFQKINEWKKNRKIYQSVGYISGPEYMKPEIFGSSFFKNDIETILKLMPEDNNLEIINKKYMQGILNVVDSREKNERYIRNFMIWLKEKDRRRNTDYKKLFPWLIEFDPE